MEKTRKPKVLHVLKSSVYSGAENVAITIIKYLQDDYDFMYLATDGTIRERLEEEHIPFLLLKKFSRSGLKRVIHDWQPDIVHAHDFSATVLCATVRGRFRLISHLHYDPPWARKWNIKTLCYWLVEPRLYRILAVSEKSYENLVFAKCLKNKHMAVGNPVDIKMIRTRGVEANLCNKYDLIFVGRLVEQKDPQRFINIVKTLRDKGVCIRCAMLGNGELEESCKRVIHENGLESQIDMIGFVSNPYPIIRNSKILCMTSKWEGYGLVLLEANILEVPVLSTRTAGAEAVLGIYAIELCNDNAGFIEKIQCLLNDKEEYGKWQHYSEKRVASLTTIESYMHLINQIYQLGLRGTEN